MTEVRFNLSEYQTDSCKEKERGEEGRGGAICRHFESQLLLCPLLRHIPLCCFCVHVLLNIISILRVCVCVCLVCQILTTRVNN